MRIPTPLCAALWAALLFQDGAAQGLNCRVLAHVDKFPGAIAPTNNYAGCWGLVGRDGKEYALIAARTGTIVYDCSNPAAPVEVAFVPGPAPASGPYFWREIQGFGDYVYVASEHGPLQVIDLRTPAAPVLAASFGGTAHSLGIDQDRGHLWAVGASGSGSLIFDLAASPTAPPQIGAYTASYVHDAFVAGGYAYLSLILDGKLRILDAQNPAQLKVLSSTTTPGQFTHGCWVDPDGQTCVLTDENRGGCLTVYDVSNKKAPVQRGTWCSPNGATAHYVYLRGNIVHLACYSDGYWALDISDPTKPQALANYDTSPLTGNDYKGDWGCYPFQPSGAVYVTDMQTGFWILEPTCGVPRHYGKPTAGKGGFVPALDYSGGYAKVGNQGFALTGKKLRGGAPVLLVLGAAAATSSLFGVDLHIDLTQPILLASGTASGTAGEAGAGAVSFGLAIPNDPGLGYQPFFTQLLVADPDAPGGMFAASQGMKLSICP